MCGIAGIVGSERIDPAAARRMLDAQRHRGPDDLGLEVTPFSALGLARLSIIGLENGRQPIVSEDGRYHLVCNGEIYNYPELRRRLETEGCRFATDSDCETILHLYRRKGPECLDDLRGMFAFSIWDTVDRTLFAARDRMGQKPFYYHAEGGRLLFASEIKALLAADPGLAELDLAGLDQYLGLRLIAPPRSMFRGIRKLPPGHSLTFGQDGLVVRRYWEPVYEPKHDRPEDDLLDELEEVLTEACRSHLLSDVPVGAFLSGGLDSSLIVALLGGRVGDRRLPTFTLGLPHETYDESPAARVVADRYDTEHHERTVTPSLVQTLPTVIQQLDEPSDPLCVPTYHLAALAHEHVKVVLGGDGGDEAFGGYDRYYANEYASLYARIPRVVRRGVIGPILGRVPDGRWYKSRAHQLKWLHRASFLEGGERYADSLTYFHFNRERRHRLFTSEAIATLGGQAAEGVLAAPYESARATHPIDRMLAADVAVRLPDHPVMLTDRMTMAHGLEARSPYMDSRLVDFAARLPVDLKVRGRGLRHLQRRLARRHLPAEIVDRPKQGFSSALPYMLRDEYRLLYKLFLSESRLAGEGILRQSSIDGFRAAHASGREDHGQRLWLLLNAEMWYRMFICGESRSDLDDRIAGAAGAGGAAGATPLVPQAGVVRRSAGPRRSTPSGTA
ncbi:MAG: asparagine synthase (glutamine-hydrolyzing) [Gemmatimonadota bacterium]|nr:asparagine synthase (glutamine-hydrolyzing) [Gemmatimonadota bacterium]